MLFSGKENIFKCLVAFQKCFGKYFLVFDCVAKNNIENTFSSCFSHFSHIFSTSKQIYNTISQQINTETKPNKKKNSSNPVNEGLRHQIRKERDRCDLNAILGCVLSAIGAIGATVWCDLSAIDAVSVRSWGAIGVKSKA